MVIRCHLSADLSRALIQWFTASCKLLTCALQIQWNISSLQNANSALMWQLESKSTVTKRNSIKTAILIKRPKPRLIANLCGMQQTWFKTCHTKSSSMLSILSLSLKNQNSGLKKMLWKWKILKSLTITMSRIKRQGFRKFLNASLKISWRRAGSSTRNYRISSLKGNRWWRVGIIIRLSVMRTFRGLSRCSKKLRNKRTTYLQLLRKLNSNLLSKKNDFNK